MSAILSQMFLLLWAYLLALGPSLSVEGYCSLLAGCIFSYAAISTSSPRTVSSWLGGICAGRHAWLCWPSISLSRTSNIPFSFSWRTRFRIFCGKPMGTRIRKQDMRLDLYMTLYCGSDELRCSAFSSVHKIIQFCVFFKVFFNMEKRNRNTVH